MSERSTYHDTFKLTVGSFTVTSYGGGYPRGVELKSDRGEIGFRYDEAPDLKYALERLLERIGPER